MRTSIEADILYGVKTPPRFSGVRLTRPIDQTDTDRRRGYLRWLSKFARNYSRREKTRIRRLMLRMEVAAN